MKRDKIIKYLQNGKLRKRSLDLKLEDAIAERSLGASVYIVTRSPNTNGYDAIDEATLGSQRSTI